MMRLIKANADRYDEGEAMAIAGELQSGEEEGWTFRAVPFVNSMQYAVEACDETGEVCGYWWTSTEQTWNDSDPHNPHIMLIG